MIVKNTSLLHSALEGWCKLIAIFIFNLILSEYCLNVLMAFEDGKALEIFLNSNFGVKMECL